jgi:Ice-binding-like
MNSITGLCVISIGTFCLTTVLAACDVSAPVTEQIDTTTLQRVSLNQIPSLGFAAPFVVFGGGAGITNQGTKTVINGEMGTSGASTMITGFHSATANYIETPLNVGSVNGQVVSNAPQGTPADFTLAKLVASDALNASNLLAALPGGTDPGAGLLGGLILDPGVYKSASGTFVLVGSDLTLDAKGDVNAVWVFQMAGSLTVGGPSASRSVVLINGAQAKNVFWQVGSAAKINGAGGGTMVGTIIANSGIVISTPGNMTISTLNGRALGLFASVTMVNTVINSPESAPKPTLSIAAPADTSRWHVVVGGSAASDVELVPGEGFLDIFNNGGFVTATEVGTGTIAVVNDGGVVTATNTGSGTMMITNTSMGSVTVTNTGKGNVTVIASGNDPITLTHTGDEDYVYPNATVGIQRRLSLAR